MGCFKTLVVGAVTAMAFQASAAYAQATTNIDATSNLTAGVTLGNEQNIDFGDIDFSAAPGAGDTAAIGTDGNLVFAGNFTGGATGNVGRVDITAGNNGTTVEVFCETAATLSDGAGSTIDIASLEVVPEGSEAAFGAGNACNGLGGAAASSFVLNVGTLDTFVFGGQLDGNTAVGFGGGALYSTGNAGGDDIQVNVFYQ
ncbi:MAG: hypothetical protein OXT65_03700 [Alphaproteobacteria bacterium]|nr:hypothetical protein [Alphaproteobacteria bacterium]